MIDDPLSLAARKIVVIAPHPDDEALGCGGLIASFAADGREVRVVFVTDGGASHPGSASWPRERLARQRRSEALEALTRLGLSADAAIFLDLPDADMPVPGSDARSAACAKLSDHLTDFGPDLMLLPWRRDPHRDHRDAWTLAHAALALCSLSPATLEYAVWLEELGTRDDHPATAEAVPVDFGIWTVLAAKRAAIEAHVSQTTTLIDDDPTGFRLNAETIERLATPVERYWRPVL